MQSVNVSLHPPRSIMSITQAPVLLALVSLLAILPQRSFAQNTGRVITGSDGSISTAPRLHGLVGIAMRGVPMRGPDGAMRFADFPSIESITPNSPAALAGLRAGDIVLKENDRDAREGKLFAADTSGIEFRIRVKRGEEILEFTVVSIMRSALPPIKEE